MEGIFELAHAKINLTLDVLARRSDGYHEVEMVMQTLDLADSVRLKKSQQGISLRISDSELPTGEGNLAWKAAKLMFDTFGLADGVEIELEKKIPVAAGLAGGSSDAAAVIRGINKLWGLNRPLEQLCELGAKIGSDVPFCIIEGTAVARGRGEILEPIAAPLPMWIVLVKPSAGVSTAEVYKKFSLAGVSRRPETLRVINAIRMGNNQEVIGLLCNVLESVTIQLVPEIVEIKEKMIGSGALNALMSGSGPTVFGIAPNKEQAQVIAGIFDQSQYTVVVTQTYNR